MSKTSIQFSKYSFENQLIRTILRNGEMWFIAKDVCKAIKISNVADALVKLDDEEKTTIALTDRQAGNGAQSISIVSESGMYTLILRCRDAVKKGTAPYKFKKWVTSEVLPSIRKTGSYTTTPSYIISPDQLIQIRRAIAYNHERTQNSFEEIYASLRKFLNIKDYETMPVEHFTAAIKFLERDLGFTYQPPILRKVYVSELNLSTLLNQMVKVTSIVNDEFKATGGSRRSPFYPLYNHFHNLSLAVSLLKCELENQKC